MVKIMTILDDIVDSKQTTASDVGLVLSLSVEPWIRCIKQQRGSVRVPAFGGLLFLYHKVH